jgi:hypothetical protein
MTGVPPAHAVALIRQRQPYFFSLELMMSRTDHVLRACPVRAIGGKLSEAK